MELKILSVYPGRSYKDTCISDMQILVSSKVEYNPQLEKKKDQALKSWIKERIKVAKYFADLPAEYPFAYTKYKRKKQKLVSGARNKIQKAALQMEALSGSGELRKASIGKRVKAAPDGLHLDPYLASYFKRDNVSLFETDKAVDRKVEYFHRRTDLDFIYSSARVKERKQQGKNEALAVYFRRTTIKSDRTEVYRKHRDYLISYNVSGKIASLYLKDSGTEYTYTNTRGRYATQHGKITERLLEFQYDPAGKITDITEVRLITKTKQRIKWEEDAMAVIAVPSGEITHKKFAKAYTYRGKK